MNQDFECPRCGHCCAEREWVGLTDEEIAEIAATPCAVVGSYVHAFARALETKLKEMNHG